MFLCNDDAWELRVYSPRQHELIRDILRDEYREMQEASCFILIISGHDLVRVLRKALAETYTEPFGNEPTGSPIYDEFLMTLMARTEWLCSDEVAQKAESLPSEWSSGLAESEVLAEADDMLGEDFDLICLGTNEPEPPSVFTVIDRHNKLKAEIRRRNVKHTKEQK